MILSGISRRSIALCCIVIGATAIALRAADLAYSQVHNLAIVNIEHARDAVCVQTVEHTRYEKKRKNSTCAELTAAGFEASRGAITWHDRFRVEVGSGVAGEILHLTAATPFEPADPGRLLGPDATRIGEFVSFLTNIVSGDAESFQPLPPRQGLAAFGFAVPGAKSHWVYGNSTIGYHGSLLAAADSGELRGLTMAAENVADACSVAVNVDYADTKIGDRDIDFPKTSVIDELLKDGTELHKETQYSSCQAPATQTKASSNEAPKPLPAGLDLHVRIQAPIDGATSAAGDPIVGVVKSNVKEGGQIVVHQGDLLHGRIALLEQYLLPYEQVGAVSAAIDPTWHLGIVFETIERNGVQQPVSLTPNDDGDRTPHDAPTTPSRLQQLRPPGGGYYIFYKKALNLDTKFEMEWTTK
jgi:hypothetical protein